MLFVLLFWVKDAKGKTRTRKKDNQPLRMQPFLVKKATGNQTKDMAMIRRKGTGELRLSKRAATQSQASDSEILVRQRIVQVFATRVEPRRKE